MTQAAGASLPRILLRAGLLTAAGLATPAASAEVRFDPAAIQADVTFLADGLLEGREPGTSGHEIAARYVAARFTQMGLTPAGSAGWFQPVRLRESTIGPAGATVTIGGTAWPSGADVIVTPDHISPARDVSGEAVFVGFGLDAPEEGFDDYAGLDVRGKIVVMLEGVPAGTPSELGAHLGRRKEAMAQKRGAVGVLTFATRTGRELFRWDRRLRNDAARMTWLAPDGSPVVETPGVFASAALNPRAAEALFAGSKVSLDAILDEAERPGGRPSAFPLNVAAGIRSTSVHRDFTSPNVLGLVRGSDPALDDEVVLVMSHLDHIGKQEGKIYHGAIDNAAGVAVLLEVARAFATAPRAPARSILFLATTGEEKGLLGAALFAESSLADKVTAVVNLDMPMITYDFEDVVALGAEHSTMGAAAERAARAVGVRLVPDPMPAEGIFTRSDHYALVRKGVPALFLVTGPGGPGAEATKTFLGTHYHQPSDSADLPLDWNAGAKLAKMTWALVGELAGPAPRPRWYANDFFGDAFAPDAPKASR